MANSREVHAPWVGFMSGFLGGAADLVVNYPFYGLRILAQTKAMHLFSMGKLYVGGGAYGALTITSTVIQDGTTTLSKKIRPTAATKYFDAAAALGGGGLSAIAATPLANIMVKQKTESLKPLPAIKALWKQGGYSRLNRAFSLILLRDSLYSGATFFWVFEAKKHLIEKHKMSNNPAHLSASVFCGVVVAALTQFADTLATKVQNDPADKVDLWVKAKEVAKKEGIRKGLHAGFIFRALSVVGGVLVMSGVSEEVQKRVAPGKT